MSWLLTLLAIAAASLVWWIVRRLFWYRRLFAVPHLMEVGQGLAAVKRAATRDMIASEANGVDSPDDTRILRTSAGFVLLYTISKGAPGTYVHHASVSIPGHPTAHAVGEAARNRILAPCSRCVADDRSPRRVRVERAGAVRFHATTGRGCDRRMDAGVPGRVRDRTAEYTSGQELRAKYHATDLNRAIQTPSTSSIGRDHHASEKISISTAP